MAIRKGVHRQRLCAEELEDRRLLAAVAHDGDGIVYHLQRHPDETLVARYSVANEIRLADIIVADSAGSIGYSTAHHRLFIGHTDSTITSLDLSLDEPAEVNFATLESASITEIFEVREIVFAGGKNSQTTLDLQGTILDRASHGAAESGYSYSSIRDSLYFVNRDENVVVIRLNPSTGELSLPVEVDTQFNVGTQVMESDDGSLLVGYSGNIYDAETFEYLHSLPTLISSLETLPNGSFAIAWTQNPNTRVEFWDAERTLIDSYDVTDHFQEFLRVNDSVVLITGSSHSGYSFATYKATIDADGDGVATAVDAFPNDAAASIDIDRDGRPDSWNDGYSAASSQTGLELDAFPTDSACQVASHAIPSQPGECDLARLTRHLQLSWIGSSDDGTIHLLDTVNSRIHRWSIAEGAYLNPIILRYRPTHAALQPDSNRLFVAYENRAVTTLDLDNFYPVERQFAILDSRPSALLVAGNRLFAIRDWMTGVFDVEGRRISEFRTDTGNVSAAEWSVANNRLYLSSGSYLDSYFVDTDSGLPSDHQRTYNDSTFARVSKDGTQVLLGNGSILDGISLQFLRSGDFSIRDAIWLDDGTLVTLSADGTSRLRHLTSNLEELNFQTFAGSPVGLVNHDDSVIVIHSVNGSLEFEEFKPVLDADGDGVLTLGDDFPYDPAASIDTDRDGYPDHWNDGYEQDDSTTGLMVDAFPFDRACQTPDHGLPSNLEFCDFSNGVANSAPVLTGQAAGVLYLHDGSQPQIDRWSLAEQAYLAPIYLDNVPVDFAVSQQRGQAIVTYEDGRLTTIDLAASSLNQTEVPFAQLAPRESEHVDVLGDHWTVWSGRQLQFFTSAGEPHDRIVFDNSLKEVTWSEATGRLYTVLIDGTVSWLSVDPSTLQRGTSFSIRLQESDNFEGLVFSPDHSQLLLGNGDIVDATTLAPLRRLHTQFSDAVWLSGGRIITAYQSVMVTEFTHWGTDGVTPLQRWTVGRTGTMDYVTTFDGKAHVLSTDALQLPSFLRHELNRDSDGDGVFNGEDDFPDDPAASRDFDRDAWPDQWNDGFDSDGSTTGLQLDAFPFDSACQSSDHGELNSPLVCDVGSQIQEFTFSQIETSEDTVFFLDRDSERIHRWSTQTESYLNPLSTAGLQPNGIKFDTANDRLLVISRFDTVLEFAPGSYEYEFLLRAPATIQQLGVADEFLVAFTAKNYVYTFKTSGSEIDSRSNTGIDSLAIWDATQKRFLYRNGFLVESLSVNESGRITVAALTTSRVLSPTSVSPDGRVITGGDGLIFDGATGEFLQDPFYDRFVLDIAWWRMDSLASVSETYEGETRIEFWSAHFVHLFSETLEGELAAFETMKNELVVITRGDGPLIHTFPLTDDHDGDGVVTSNDAFPDDPAASLDSDRDGYPDAWHLGSMQTDSTTDLTLDAFPLDSACFDISHQLPGTSSCDASVDKSAFDPTEILLVGEDIHMLSRFDRKIYRWSTRTESFLNPIILEALPIDFTYSATHSRIYVAYENGNVNYIDVESENAREQHFVTISSAPTKLIATGSFVTVVDNENSYDIRVFNFSGELESTHHSYGGSIDWNEHTHQLYFTSYFVKVLKLDRVTGQFQEFLTSEYDRHSFEMGISVSDTGRVVTATGLVLDDELRPTHAVERGYIEAIWNDEGHLIRVSDSEPHFVVVKIAVESPLDDLGYQIYFNARPLRVLAGRNVAHVVTRSDDGLRFIKFSIDNRGGVRQNIQSPTDVDDDEAVSPLDALFVINALPGSGLSGNDAHFYDVDGDTTVSPIDALLVINALGDATAAAAAPVRMDPSVAAPDSPIQIRDHAFSEWAIRAKDDEENRNTSLPIFYN